MKKEYICTLFDKASLSVGAREIDRVLPTQPKTKKDLARPSLIVEKFHYETAKASLT